MPTPMRTSKQPAGARAPQRKATSGNRARAEGHFARGLTLSQADRWDEGAAEFEKATALCPKDGVFWVNLSQAYRKLGRHEDCVAAARKAVSAAPDLAVASQLLADGLKAQHRYGDAAVALREVAQAHDTTHTRYELAHALLQAGKPLEAVNEFLSALEQTPHYIPGHLQLGNVFKSLKLHREAMECFLTASELDRKDAASLAAMLYEALYACEWARFDEQASRLSELVQSHVPTMPVPFMFLSMSTSRDDQLRVAQAFARNYCKVGQPLPPQPAFRQRADRRPRVGYFSNDLRLHPVSVNIVEVIEQHDREAIDLFVYSYGPNDNSHLRQRIAAAAGERFIDAHHMANRALAERIRADGIELLIDLTGFTKDSRTGIMALRPAPVQAAYLGFPGTSGADFIDYLICDAHIAPIEHAAGYSEKLAHLPVTYQPNDRKRQLLPPPPRSECNIPDDAFVFCCMNNNYKITPEIFGVWCRLLQQVPDSVLWLFDANAQARGNLQAHGQARGVAAERIIFAPLTSTDKHLARMRNADLFLDTLPYNAHTTGGDVLIAGVPMITCPGETFTSRVAGSLLHGAGLPELVASSLEEYEATALRLAQQPQELQRIRARLWANHAHAPLFDSLAATRNLEHLYARMVQRWRDGLAPDHLGGEPAPVRTTHAAEEMV
jgi:protein O-GlcNAc transferase